MIVQVEIVVVEVVIASYGILAINFATRDECRLTADIAQFVEQVACFFPADAFHLDRCVGQITGLCIVGEGQVSHADHLAHQFHLFLGHTVIEPSSVSEDGIYEDPGALFALFPTVSSYELGLFVAEHQSCADGIETEAEFFPYG